MDIIRLVIFITIFHKMNMLLSWNGGEIKLNMLTSPFDPLAVSISWCISSCDFSPSCVLCIFSFRNLEIALWCYTLGTNACVTNSQRTFPTNFRYHHTTHCLVIGDLFGLRLKKVVWPRQAPQTSDFRRQQASIQTGPEMLRSKFFFIEKKLSRASFFLEKTIRPCVEDLQKNCDPIFFLSIHTLPSLSSTMHQDSRHHKLTTKDMLLTMHDARTCARVCIAQAPFHGHFN